MLRFVSFFRQTPGPLPVRGRSFSRGSIRRPPGKRWATQKTDDRKETYLAPHHHLTMRKLILLLLVLTGGSCSTTGTTHTDMPDDARLMQEAPQNHKLVIYQMMTRLFGNTTTTNRPWGTRDENGVGKFGDVNDQALTAIRALGATHVWYTGVVEHAVCTDYRADGIPLDDADVVKGRAGSPYAIKDYYDVNPDLAHEVPRRMEEFEALIARTHAQRLKVIIDFVPNHVARRYHSDVRPDTVRDFGADDDVTVDFAANNSFYYLPGEPFRVPEGYVPLGGEPFPTADGTFDEMPAKVSGNGAVTPQPALHDWFETVRLNYGVNHVGDGSTHFSPIPATWEKCRDVLAFWVGKGVDGFRCDMAEMVPVQFWGWVIPQIQALHPDVIFIAEIYNPAAYRDYIFEGKFDYLYDKVGMYDSVRAVMEDRPGTSAKYFTTTWESLKGINPHMLRFLENHDEQRIASPYFAGSPAAGVPGMVVTAALGSGPVMVYFGQEVGEPGAGAEGFGGDDGRTTIFDYWGVPQHQRWMNNHRYDGGGLSGQQRALRAFYVRLLNTVRTNEALSHGALYDLQPANLENPAYNADRVYAFLRFTEAERILVVANFLPRPTHVRIRVPAVALAALGLATGAQWTAHDLLAEAAQPTVLRRAEMTEEGIPLDLPAHAAVMLKF